MSKTDKTKPVRVQIAENAIADHDHSKGECDLPTLADFQKMHKRERWALRCTWEPKSWHDITYARSKGERFWRTEDRKRKDSKRGKDDWTLDIEDDEDVPLTGCQICCDHGGNYDY